jgi:hypothetical protein
VIPVDSDAETTLWSELGAVPGSFFFQVEAHGSGQLRMIAKG